MEKVVGFIVGLLLIPIVLLNLFGGLVTGIMLLIGGDWGPLIAGLLFLFAGVFLISILMLPSLLVSGLAIYFMNRKNRFGVGISVLVSQLLIYAIMFGVSYAVFSYMLQYENDASRLVLLIWSFSVAVAPWSYMASKERDNEGTQLTLFTAQAGLFTVLILAGFFNKSLYSSFHLIAALTIIPACFTTAYAVYKIHNSGEALLTDGLGEGTGDFTQKELIAFVVGLLYVAAIDGVMHPDEIKHVRKSFGEVTGQRISRAFVERIYHAIETGGIDVEDTIRDANDEISDKMKLNIINGAYLIAKADNVMRPEELGAIKELGKMLGMPSKQLFDILKPSNNQR